MRLLVAALALPLFACGRFGFDDVGPGGSAGDGGVGSNDPDALGTGIDGATDRPNVAFVTSMTTVGAFGGVAGADTLCAEAAAIANLPGTFVPLLSSQTTDVRARLAGSRGWVRTGDGAPVADTVDGLYAGALFNPINRDESGNRTTAPQFAWIGGTTTGGSVDNCGEWTATAGWGNHGFVGGAMPELMSPYSVYLHGCGVASALTCLEIGHAYPVQPTGSGARIAFIAPPAPHGGGIAQLDAECQAQADSAGLPGTFLAAVATQGTTAASRFTPGAGWTRPDGTVVTVSSGTLFDGSEPLSFVNQFADGTYAAAAGMVRTGGLPTVAGSNASTCNSWTTTSGSNAGVGIKVARFDLMWQYVQSSCLVNAYTMCLEN